MGVRVAALDDVHGERARFVRGNWERGPGEAARSEPWTVERLLEVIG